MRWWKRCFKLRLRKYSILGGIITLGPLKTPGLTEERKDNEELRTIKETREEGEAEVNELGYEAPSRTEKNQGRESIISWTSLSSFPFALSRRDRRVPLPWVSSKDEGREGGWLPGCWPFVVLRALAGLKVSGVSE